MNKKKVNKFLVLLLMCTMLVMLLADVGQAYVGQGSTGATRGYWRFNDHGDQQADDTSNRGNHGTLVNDPTWTTSGKFGYALDFDGSDDHVDCGNNNSLDNTGEITVETWVKPESAAAWETILERRDHSGNKGYTLDIGSDSSSYRFQMYDTTFRWVQGGSLTTGQWAHIAGVYDGSYMRLYVNGVEVGTPYSLTPNNYPGGTLWIGNDTFYNEPFDGIVDEVRVLDFARTGFSGGVVVNEVCYGSTTDDWIELHNHGSATIDCRNMLFVDSDNQQYKVPNDGSHTIAPGNYVVIYLNSTGTDSTGAWYTCNGQITTLGPGDLDAADVISVYDLDNNDDGTDDNTYGTDNYRFIVDFVAWGGTQSDDDDEAVSAGLWGNGDWVAGSDSTDSVYLKGDGNNDEAVSDWAARDESTPGAPVPDVSALILFTCGLILIGTFFVCGRKKFLNEVNR